MIRSRRVLERDLFEADGDAVRDDVAEICMAIDDVLSDDPRAQTDAENARNALERSAA